MIQASSASIVTLMTALYMHVLRPEDRVAVKPHASPVFHAIQYLLGNQTRDKLERFRALGGAQSYPSRTKDSDDVDFSTGSVGLGVAMTAFAGLVRDYVDLTFRTRGTTGDDPGSLEAAARAERARAAVTSSVVPAYRRLQGQLQDLLGLAAQAGDVGICYCGVEGAQQLLHGPVLAPAAVERDEGRRRT